MLDLDNQPAVNDLLPTAVEQIQKAGYSAEDVFSVGSIRRVETLNGDMTDAHKMRQEDTRPGWNDHLIDFRRVWNGKIEALESGGNFSRSKLKFRKVDITNRIASKYVKNLVWALNYCPEAETGRKPRGYAAFPDNMEYIQRLLAAMNSPEWENATDYSPETQATIKHINLDAETQWGKTILNVASWIFSIGRHRKSNFLDLILLPTRNELFDNTELTLEACENIYEVFTYEDSQSSIADNISDYRDELDRCEGLIAYKGISSTIENLDQLFATAKKNGIVKVRLRKDEADEAAAIDSIFDKIVELATRHGLLFQLVLFSATGYPYECLERFNRIPVEFPKDTAYSGTVQGKRTPVASMSSIERDWGVAGLSLVRPSLIKSSSDYDAIRRATSGEYGFASKKTTKMVATMVAPSMLPKLHGGYAKFCADVLFDLFSKIATNKKADGTPIFPHGPFSGGRSALWRFGDKNSANPVLGNIDNPGLELKLNSIGIGVVRTSSDDRAIARQTMSVVERKRDAERKSKLAYAIEECLKTYEYCIVAVLGVGRRGDDFPTHTTIFVDFTEEFSTSTAHQQGSLGRASGHNKITDVQSTYVILSDRNANLTYAFRYGFDKYGRKIPFSINPGSGAVKADNNIRLDFSSKSKWDVRFAQYNHPTFDSIRNDINRIIAPHIKVKRDRDDNIIEIALPTKTGKTKDIVTDEYIIYKGDYYFPVYDQILSETRMNEIQNCEQNVMGILRASRPGDNGANFDTHHRNMCWVRISVGSHFLHTVHERQIRLVRGVSSQLDMFLDQVWIAVNESESANAATGKKRLAPILRLAAEMDIFHHAESLPELISEAGGAFEIARPGFPTVFDHDTGFLDYNTMRRMAAEEKGLDIDEGLCQFFFSASGPVTKLHGLGLGTGEDRQRFGDLDLQMQITIRKFDSNGKIIEGAKWTERKGDTSGWKIINIAVPNARAEVNEPDGPLELRKSRKTKNHFNGFDRPEFLFHVNANGEVRIQSMSLPLSETVVFLSDNIKNIEAYKGTYPQAPDYTKKKPGGSMFSKLQTSIDIQNKSNGDECVEP